MSSPNRSGTVSPQLLTPRGTPPNPAPIAFPPTMFSEARLAQLLSSFDHGTHSFDRAERETPEERRMSFGEALPPRLDRRQSFLSALSLSRPGFGFASSPYPTTETPLHTPLSGSCPARPALSLPLGRDTGKGDPTAPTTLPDSMTGARPLSVPPPPGGVKPPPEIQRANTAPQKTYGFRSKEHDGEQRHFDPSKEPRLLGLL